MIKMTEQEWRDLTGVSPALMPATKELAKRYSALKRRGLMEYLHLPTNIPGFRLGWARTRLGTDIVRGRVPVERA